jgi:hypothetical protein
VLSLPVDAFDEQRFVLFDSLHIVRRELVRFFTS